MLMLVGEVHQQNKNSKISLNKTFNLLNNMRLQVIQDGRGKDTGVFISIKDWNALKKKHKDLATLEYEKPTKEQLIMELKQAVIELKLIENGKLKARPIEELFDEV